MKRTIESLLIIGIVLSVVGCGKDKAVYYSDVKDKESIAGRNDKNTESSYSNEIEKTIDDAFTDNKEILLSEETPVEDFDYEFDNYREGIIIRKYHGTNNEVVIPREIEGYPVFSVGTGAFYESDIISVILPETLIDIQPKAFLDCGSLTGIGIPENVTHIYEDAFSRCEELQRVLIESKTVRISDCAFFDCPKLKSVIFKWNEDSVVLEGSPFYGCPNLNDDSKEAILQRNPKLTWNDKAGFRRDLMMRSN